MKKTFALLIVFMLILSLMIPSYVFAADKGGSGSGKGQGQSQASEPAGKDKSVKQDTDTPASGTTTDADSNSKDSNDKNAVKASGKEQLKVLKEQYTEAAKTGNAEQKAQLKQQIKDLCVELKQEIKSSYTKEEAVKLEKVGEELKKADPSITVLPVENVVALGKNMKLDTPPVVKDGRVLVPVRALSSAFGAEVQYDQATKQVTIVKDGITVVLKLDSKTVVVNGVETQLDVPAKSLNGRTVVPLRFIAEKLGLKVDYEEQTGTVIVDDGTSGTGSTSTGGDSNTSTGTTSGTTGSTTGTSTGDSGTGTQSGTGTTTGTDTGTGTGTGTVGQ